MDHAHEQIQSQVLDTRAISFLFFCFSAVVPSLAARATCVFDTSLRVSVWGHDCSPGGNLVIGKFFSPWDLGPFVQTAINAYKTFLKKDSAEKP